MGKTAYPLVRATNVSLVRDNPYPTQAATQDLGAHDIGSCPCLASTVRGGQWADCGPRIGPVDARLTPVGTMPHMDNETVACRDCVSPIPADATRCRHCGARQQSWWEPIGTQFAIVAVVVLAVVFWIGYQNDRADDKAQRETNCRVYGTDC